MENSECQVHMHTLDLDVAALVLQLLTCFFGVIGSILSLICLLTCKRIQRGMKIQLALFFTIILLICLVGMPGAVVVEFMALRCWHVASAVEVVFSAGYTIGVALERNIFATMAVYRLIAVCSPQKYKALSRWGIVVAVEVVLCVGVILMWLPTFILQDNSEVDVNNPTTSKVGYALYFVVFLFPIFVSVLAYFLLFAVILLRKQRTELKTGKHSKWNDQVNFAVGVLILANLLLDVPHITIHLSGFNSKDVAFIVVHIIYRLHLLLDSCIFIALNSYYRRKILRLVLKYVPGCSGRFSVPVSSTIESSSRRPDSISAKTNPMYSTTV